MAKNSIAAGDILHFGAVRYRVTGSGNLTTIINSLDDVKTSTLANIIMATTTNKEPLVLANFSDQRGYIQFGTSAIDETFTISRIVVYVKPVATGYPQ
jgi:hypothetical protein